MVTSSSERTSHPPNPTFNIIGQAMARFSTSFIVESPSNSLLEGFLFNIFVVVGIESKKGGCL